MSFLKDLLKASGNEYASLVSDGVTAGDVDSFIDETDLFDDFEDILPDEEYGIFVITLLNGIRSETVINMLLDSILNTIQSKSAVLNS